MQIHRFLEDARPERLERLETLPEKGFVWLDFVREEAPDWADRVKEITGVRVFDAHIADSLNPRHPSYFDETDDYEMLIFRELAPDPHPRRFETRAIAFFLLPRALVSVHSPDSAPVATVTRRLQEKTLRVPRRPAGLMHHVLSSTVDRFLQLRDPLVRQLEAWQESLLDPHDPFDDWLTLMRHKNELRTLETVAEEHIDAVTNWREETAVELDEHLNVRFNDLLEHVRRVLHHSTHVQEEIEALVQLHFSALANRTNEVMRVLTVVAAIFLPLNLVAGIFGMNFEHMPELKWRWAYYGALGIMALVGFGMLWHFRRRKWI
jgi:magnesium/cobalt transport protein CorA